MSYVGAITNVVGGEISGWAAMLARDAMYKSYLHEQARQKGYADQAGKVMGQAIPQSGPEQAQRDMAQGYGERMGDYKTLESTPLSVGGGGGPTARDQAFGDQVAQNRARLGSYGDWGLQKSIRDLQTQQKLNQITNFAGGTASVYPYRQYQAQHSADQLAMIGAAISSIGGGAANYAQYAQGPNVQPGGVGAGGGYGAGIYYPSGSQYGGYSQMGGFGTPYGNYYGAGWNTLGGNYEGTVVPG